MTLKTQRNVHNLRKIPTMKYTQKTKAISYMPFYLINAASYEYEKDENKITTQ